MKQYRRVFAALDGGSTQQEVAERAIQIAKLNHAELMFGHVGRFGSRFFDGHRLQGAC